MARAKIALLYVGGSIGMKANQKTGRIEPVESVADIHRFLPELQKEVALKFISISNIGSSEVTPDHWVQIAEAIEKHYNQFDGFVVVHGSNTMAYTASALAFALQNLSKPVVLTGAVLPINEITGDARMNLIFAIRAAQLDLAEVCIVMGPRVLRGVRAKKVDESFLNTFSTPKVEPLADFSDGVLLADHRLVRRKRTLSCKPTFNPEVVLLTLNPGLPERYLDAILDAEPHGIILRSYGTGMVSDSIIPWLQKVAMKDIPVVFTSQLVRGKVDLHKYRKQLALEQMGVISGKDMSFECAVTKLMWALTQSKSPRRLRDIMEKNLVGEITE